MVGGRADPGEVRYQPRARNLDGGLKALGAPIEASPIWQVTESTSTPAVYMAASSLT